MDISIVVAVSRPELVQACIEAFQKQIGGYQFEVILVGNVAKTTTISPNIYLVKTLVSHPNHKRNMGVKMAKSSFIGLMDDDAIPDVNWVKTAVECTQLKPFSIFSGPELPTKGGNRFSKLTYKMLSSRISEFSKGHINHNSETVQWFDVPFCNCVFPKRLWEENNGLSEDIPWHMDDFHFFFTHQHKEFINCKDLLVFHDRYPNSLSQLLQYKWRIRKETGQKLVLFPEIYWAVSPVKFSFLFSILSIFVVLTSIALKPILISFFLSFYLLLIAILTVERIGLKSIHDLINGCIIVGVVQVTTFVALYFGFIATLLSLIGKKQQKNTST